MKNFYKIKFLVFLLASGHVLADVVTTKRQINRPSGVGSYSQTKTNSRTSIQSKPTGTKLSNSVKSCKPYSEQLNSNVGGMDFAFNITIAGWVNNKCRVDFIAQSTGINSLFESLYGVSPSQAQISTFEPKIKCEFTKQQLERVGDSILQEEERNRGARNNMLKNPADIDISGFANMSGSDAELMNVILNDRACTILNAGNSQGIFESLFNF